LRRKRSFVTSQSRENGVRKKEKRELRAGRVKNERPLRKKNELRAEKLLLCDNREKAMRKFMSPVFQKNGGGRRLG